MVKYVQGKDDGIIFRQSEEGFARFNPWKGKWEKVEESNGRKQFGDWDDNRICVGENIDEVVKKPIAVCKGEGNVLENLSKVVLK